ncbi:hypothetical protein MHYMCMPSP_00487 [Hyalomma marginatum]|uniref:Uncharacterized protein n=1 Tax=Hyalomma marginatum TaxID=34627 RepID=A0A8S4C1N8_9ACAR|nr:hypothetical protein MHYMCMPSP_00487 [Hyalomma marginatum]CAG7600380.1 hypothetical protein MHYMCMPASI_01176 [Hyalomma marginatum]
MSPADDTECPAKITSCNTALITNPKAVEVKRDYSSNTPLAINKALYTKLILKAIHLNT